MTQEPGDTAHVALVVDDEPAMLEVLEETLRRAPMDVVGESDPRRASALLAKGGFDLVVLDLRMPHLDGLALLERLRDRSAATPVIVVTGYPSTESLRRCRALGVVHYLRKPFDPEELLRCARSALQPGAGAGGAP